MKQIAHCPIATMKSLSDELILTIVRFCHIVSAGCLSVASKRFHRLISKALLEQKCTWKQVRLVVGYDDLPDYRWACHRRRPWCILSFGGDIEGEFCPAIMADAGSIGHLGKLKFYQRSSEAADYRRCSFLCFSNYHEGTLQELDTTYLLNQNDISGLVLYCSRLAEIDMRLKLALAHYVATHPTSKIRLDTQYRAVWMAITYKASVELVYPYLPLDVQSAWPDSIVQLEEAKDQWIAQESKVHDWAIKACREQPSLNPDEFDVVRLSNCPQECVAGLCEHAALFIDEGKLHKLSMQQVLYVVELLTQVVAKPEFQFYDWYGDQTIKIRQLLKHG